jgi:phosphoglycerate-specific signal transduction histidine kinase
MSVKSGASVCKNGWQLSGSWQQVSPHDFNNIGCHLVYTDLLMSDRSLPALSRDRLTIIQQQVQRASSLIRQILDFSRRSMMEQHPLDLLPFVKELDKLLSRVLPETIHLELKYQHGAYMVNGDPTRLQQVFMNLALNAGTPCQKAAVCVSNSAGFIMGQQGGSRIPAYRMATGFVSV